MPSWALLLMAGALVAAGVYLVLERTLSRVIIGLSLLTNGVNALLLASGGPAGRPPLLGTERAGAIADPLPQAMILTSIVISLGMTAFGLALAYRSWRLSGHDEVVDDVEDRRLARRVRPPVATPVQDATASGDEDADVDYDASPEQSAPPGAPHRPGSEDGPHA